MANIARLSILVAARTLTASRTTFRSSALLMSVTLLFGLGACASRGPAASGLPSDGIIEVENRTWDDLVVYVVRGNGTPMRVGRVDGNGRNRFKLPAGMMEGANLQLQASRLNGHAQRTSGFVEPTRHALGVSTGGTAPYVTVPFVASDTRIVSWVSESNRFVSGVTVR